MLKENNKVLKCSNASPDWRGYVDFVNNVVVDGMSRVICASLEYLLDQVRLTSQQDTLASTAPYGTYCTTFRSAPTFGGTKPLKLMWYNVRLLVGLKATTTSPKVVYCARTQPLFFRFLALFTIGWVIRNS